MFAPKDITRDAKMALEELERFEESLPFFLKGVVPGTRALTQAEKRAFLSQKLQEFPPEPFVNDETGESLTISPWVLALRFAKGGPEMLKELETAILAGENV